MQKLHLKFSFFKVTNPHYIDKIFNLIRFVLNREHIKQYATPSTLEPY